jgi:hypothetical protein
MALKRQDKCTHVMRGSAFTSCTLRYDADYNSKQRVIAVTVLSADLPGNSNPNDAQVQAIADPKATAIFNQWKTAVDSAAANPVVLSEHAGQSATLIA